MKLSKTDYRGSPALRLATRSFELIAPTAYGPRILSLRSLKAGGNLMYEYPPDDGGAAGPDGLKLRGGHRLWHAPEHIVRTYQPDNDPPDVRETKDGVQLAAAPEEKTGMQKTVALRIVNDRTVRVTHTLANRGLWAVETAPWALTMLRRGGYGVVPLMPKGSHAAGDLLPTYSLVPWSYTDLSLPCWDLHTDFIGIDTRKAKTAQKLGLTNYPGWSAYWLDGVTFVKHARVVPGASYPDFGCAFETFCNDTMIEFETLAPLTRLDPGGSAVHVEHWGVLDGLERPATDAAYARLAAAVAAWLRKL